MSHWQLKEKRLSADGAVMYVVIEGSITGGIGFDVSERETAEHIVRAVNSYQALRSACINAEYVIGHALNPQRGRPEEGGVEQLLDVLEELRAALELTEQEQPR